MSPVLGQIYAPVYYQELTTHRRKNTEIQYKSEILKLFKLPIYRMT
jgi:hypothetical protein